MSLFWASRVTPLAPTRRTSAEMDSSLSCWAAMSCTSAVDDEIVTPLVPETVNWPAASIATVPAPSQTWVATCAQRASAAASVAAALVSTSRPAASRHEPVAAVQV